MNTSYQLKAFTRDKMNIAQFSQTHGIGRGNTFFFTLTFKDNIKDKKEASKMWFNLRSYIQKNFPRFRYIMVSERQGRGAWHFHLLCSAIIPSLNKFVRSVENFCRCSSFKYGFVNARWTSGVDYKGIAVYLTKYLTKEKREKGIRYVSYSNNWVRACRLPFAWVGGKSAEWRKRCRELHAKLGVHFTNFYNESRYFDKVEAITSACFEDSLLLVKQWLNGCERSIKKIYRTTQEGVSYMVYHSFEPLYNPYTNEIRDVLTRKRIFEVQQ